MKICVAAGAMTRGGAVTTTPTTAAAPNRISAARTRVSRHEKL